MAGSAAPTGAPNRRAWFLYEFLTGRTLDIPDAVEASFTDLLDDRLYFTAAPRLSRRHKVRDNLLGTYQNSLSIDQHRLSYRCPAACNDFALRRRWSF